MADYVIDPWNIEGEIDYKKVIKEFGLSPMNFSDKEFKENILYRRGIVFAQRDLERIMKAKREGNDFAMMTGLMPSGKFHIGHMIVAQQMIFWQNMGAKIYIAVADIEAYNARGQSLEESRRIAEEVYIPNYIALGLKPENCEIYFQSDRSKDSKKSNAYYRLQNMLAKHITHNEVRAVYGDTAPGKMFSGVLQAADMLHPQLREFSGKCPVVVPVGVDQDPHIRLARDMAQRFKDFSFIQLSSTYHTFVPGLKGGKMSSSDPTSFISLDDSPEDAKKKINKYAFSGGGSTVEEHKEKGGNPDIDVPFQYLRALFEPDDDKIKEIYEKYKSGEMLTGEMKKYLIEKITSFLEDHQKKLKKAKKEVGKFLGD